MNFIKGPFNSLKNIVLASSSPRRQQLLSSLGIYFEVVNSNIKEKDKGDSPERLVLENARLKVEGVLKKRVKGVIIGADTSVVLDGEIIGKPKNREDALVILKKLMDRWHEVYTGCYIVDTMGNISQEFVVKTEVLMDKFDDEVINKYLDTKEPMDKAGSYAIQGVGAFLIKEIRGSFTNVIGLPMNELTKYLLKLFAIGI